MDELTSTAPTASACPSKGGEGGGVVMTVELRSAELFAWALSCVSL